MTDFDRNDEPRPDVDPDSFTAGLALDDDDDLLSEWATEHDYDYTPGQWPSPIGGAS